MHAYTHFESLTPEPQTYKPVICRATVVHADQHRIQITLDYENGEHRDREGVVVPRKIPGVWRCDAGGGGKRERERERGCNR